jgi:hypothetical protein
MGDCWIGVSKLDSTCIVKHCTALHCTTQHFFRILHTHCLISRVNNLQESREVCPPA